MYSLASLIWWLWDMGVFEEYVLQKVATIMCCDVHILLPLLGTAGLDGLRTSSLLQECKKKNSEGTLILNKILLSVLIQRKTLDMNGGEIILHLQITVAYRRAHQNFKEYIKNVLLLFPKVEKPLKKPWLYSFKRSDFYMHNILFIFSL